MAYAVSVAQHLFLQRDTRRLGLAIGVLFGLSATAVAAVVAATGAGDHQAAVATGRALMVGVPIFAGLYAWSRRADARFGLLLIAAGGACLLTSLAESSDPELYSLGRAAGWLLEVALVYVVLAFPSGRLQERADRLLVGAMAAVALTLFLPRLVLAQQFELPSPYTSCTEQCPDNAFFALDQEPAFVADLMRPLGTLLAIVVLTAVCLRLLGRVRRASPLARRMLLPVLAVAALRAALIATGFVVRAVEPQSGLVKLLGWLIALAVPAIALALLLGQLRWRFFAGRALERLAECLQRAPDAATLRRAFAEAFGDPSVQVAFPTGSKGGWLDCWSQPVALPEPGSGRAVSIVHGQDGATAAIVHDQALQDDPRLIEAGLAMAGVVLDNQRLTAKTDAAMREVRDSRTRIAAGAERERKRIERDLHDGAQQRLVALRIELGLAEDVVRTDPQRGIDRLRELERDVDAALEELRALAHGVYPPVLSDQGIAGALRAAAARSPIVVDVEARDVGRYPVEVESAVYFCVMEALQNVLKHARARRVRLRLDGSGGRELRFTVRDDGRGAPGGTVSAGAGITNMHDRLEALNGEVTVQTRPGVGTTVRGRVPAAQRAPAGAAG
jgi:signal transduction histidine kinase